MADTTVNELNGKIKDIENKIQEFFKQINDTLSWIPDSLSWVIDRVEDGIQAINQKLQEFWKEVKKFLDMFGNVNSLKDKADQWEMKVARPLGDIAGEVALNNLRANIEWEGRAAEAYKSMVPSQGDGLSSLKTLARQVQSSLDSLANALTAFYVALSTAFAVFITGLVTAIVACATVVGTPVGVADILTVIGVVVGLLTAAITAMVTFTNSLATEQTALTQKIHDVGETWPKSAMDDLSDGSESDGDASDWRINE